MSNRGWFKWVYLQCRWYRYRNQVKLVAIKRKSRKKQQENRDKQDIIHGIIKKLLLILRRVFL